jgi:propionyl-CoA synthetase
LAGWVPRCISLGWLTNRLSRQVVGHSFILYAPLLAGATTVQFEGKPIWPDAGIFWRTIQSLKVNVLFTAPTALRAIRQADPELKRLEDVGARGGLKTLRTLFLAGERSEPNIIDQFGDVVRRHAGPGASVVDNWWSSESGSPMTGIAQVPESGWVASGPSAQLAVQTGSAGKPMPGFNVKVVDDDGNECERGTMGNIVLGIPLGPTAMTKLWKDEDRFWNSYLRRFDGRWFDTGDAGMVSRDGYLSVMSRTDDIINVAAHRLSTGGKSDLSRNWLIQAGAIEQAVCSHPSVAEACVIGMPDALKGQLPFAFVTMGGDAPALTAERCGRLLGEIQQLIRAQIGPIATLGGMIEGRGMIPRTRSGKTLRRVLRDLVENAVSGQFERDVQVPATIEDRDVVGVARTKIKQYFETRAANVRGVETKAKM